jgi:hypothetical protein
MMALWHNECNGNSSLWQATNDGREIQQHEPYITGLCDDKCSFRWQSIHKRKSIAAVGEAEETM